MNAGQISSRVWVSSSAIPLCYFHKTFRYHGACYGRCAAKKETYFGYKLHLLCTLSGFPVRYLLTSANVDDRKPTALLVQAWEGWALLADKGYHGLDFIREFFNSTGIHILPLQKSGQPLPNSEKSLRQFIFRARRRIETLGSQLTDQLNLQRVRSKSLWGLTTRIASKYLAFSLVFLINFLFGCVSPSFISKRKLDLFTRMF